MDARNIDNPYWEQVSRIPNSPFGLTGRPFSPESYGNIIDKSLPEDTPMREELVRKYSWAIPSPETLSLITEHLGDREVVEIGAGTGYWANLLSQLGVKVHAFDIAPPNDEVNPWHMPERAVEHHHTEETVADWHLVHEATVGLFEALSHAFGPLPEGTFPQQKAPSVGDPYFTRELAEETRGVFHPVKRGGTERAATHPGAALFLCWPPYNKPMAYDALRFYPGDMLVYCGEHYGCTANDDFFELLEREWEEVATNCMTHVSWDGLRDYVTIYTRKAVRA